LLGLSTVVFSRSGTKQVKTGRQSCRSDHHFNFAYPTLTALGQQHLCPPRDVRNFRVVMVQDARTQRKPSPRLAQVTVWDALSLINPEESNTDTFQVGRRFKVSRTPIMRGVDSWTRENFRSRISFQRNKVLGWTRERDRKYISAPGETHDGPYNNECISLSPL
jgi:hypothetical protein